MKNNHRDLNISINTYIDTFLDIFQFPKYSGAFLVT